MERIIAYFDLLGFRKMVMGREESDEIQSQLESVWENARKFQSDRISFVIFSDTVVFYSKEIIDFTICQEFIDKCKLFVNSMLCLEIPLRGVIACGDFNVANFEESTLFYGRALIEAYDSESNEKTIGVNIHPSLSKKFDEEISQLIGCKEREYYRRFDDYIYINPLFEYINIPDDTYNYNFSDPYPRQVDLKIISFLHKSQNCDVLSQKEKEKYIATINIIKKLLGENWFAEIASEIMYQP